VKTELTGIVVKGNYTLNDAGLPLNLRGKLPTTLLSYAWRGAYEGVQDINHRYNPTYDTEYTLNETILPSPGVIPYNSTFWYENISHPLSAPFLKPAFDCIDYTGYRRPLNGSCMCFRDTPLNFDWSAADNMFCMSGAGYSWGFSSFVTLFGLALELAWVSICYLLWLDANFNSRLLRYRRNGYGTFRSTLDLAEAIHRELGGATSAYSNGELKKALEGREEIGFSVEEKTGANHIGIVPKSRKKQDLKDWVTGIEVYG